MGTYHFMTILIILMHYITLSMRPNIGFFLLKFYHHGYHIKAEPHTHLLGLFVYMFMQNLSVGSSSSWHSKN